MDKAKGIMPTHQYMPSPNYAVEQAISYGKELIYDNLLPFKNNYPR